MQPSVTVHVRMIPAVAKQDELLSTEKSAVSSSVYVAVPSHVKTMLLDVVATETSVPGAIPFVPNVTPAKLSMDILEMVTIA